MSIKYLSLIHIFIAETEAYEKAGNICLYMPVRNEVEVTLMEKQARKDGKTLWIPKVEGEILTFYRWDEDMEDVYKRQK